MKILFTGYYGFKNFGDDLFPVAAMHGVQRKNCTVGIMSAKIQGVDANFLVPDFLSGLYSGNGIFSKLLRALFLLKGAIYYDYIILAGGSVLSSNTSILMRKLQYFLSKMHLVKLCAIGVSVGPFTNNKDLVFYKKFIDELKYLSVRDDESVVECQRLGCAIIPKNNFDLVGVLYPYIRDLKNMLPNHNEVKTLGVSLCYYERYHNMGTDADNQRCDYLIDGVVKYCLEHKDVKVKVICLNSNDQIGDGSVSNYLHTKLIEVGVDCEVVCHADPYETINAILSVDYYLTTRLHGGIVAYLAGIRFVLVEYHRKCKDFNDLILNQGEWRLTDNNISVDSVAKNIRVGLEEPMPLTLFSDKYHMQSINSFSMLNEC